MIHKIHLKHLVEKFEKARILCVGDVMLDRFVYGTVDRISPEAPVPVFHIERGIETLGGAGNVARNLVVLGATVSFCAVIGQDETGEKIQTLLNELEGVSPFLIHDVNRKSTTKTRFLSNGQQLLRADQESKRPLDSSLKQLLYKHFETVLGQVEGVILSDYGKGMFDPEILKTLIALAKEQNKFVIVDPKHPDYIVYQGATLITPNAKELKEASRLSVSTDEEVERAASHLLDRCQVEAVLATRGSKGMTLVKRNEKAVHIPTRALEVFDVSGAGDTVIATLGMVLAVGGSFEEAALLANETAGIVVAKVGTAAVSQKELHQCLEENNSDDWELKNLGLADAVDQVVLWHRQGYRVGFTNGCFDLLHPGHLSSLRQAKRQCDRLIVALNSDASVRRLKGDSRPIQDQETRAQILASLEMVDLVVIFDEETPLEVIKKLRPDVLVKGEDYKGKEITGAKEVQSWGGEVVLATFERGHSTTSMLQKIQKDQ